MIRNYFKIAFRNLWRNKGFSAINIFGLAIGIGTCLIMLLFVQHELSYDRFNTKADRIVRVVFNGHVKGEKMKEANVFPPVAQTLKNDYPEVQEATRLCFGGAPLVTYQEKTFQEYAFAYADANFFQVFTLPLIQGNAATALAEPNTVIITKALAEKYFGQDDPIGKILNFKTWNTAYKVTGVINKVPDNSHFHFDMFASMASLPDAKSDSWMTSNYFTYLVLPNGYDYRKLEAKLPQAVDKYMGPQLKQAMGISMAEFRAGGNNVGIYLQPLTDIHLHSDFTNDLEPAGDIRYVYIYSAIALFMLLIACINFMNLSTASASKRAREVGIRKVMGSLKGQIMSQFLLESILITAFALLVAVAFVALALPLFNHLSGKNLQLISNTWLIPGLLLLGLLTGVLAGSYPAFFLSSFKPVAVLKGNMNAGKKSIGLRSSLVVFQFFISITLIVGTVVVYNQLSYIQNKKLGYNKDQVLLVPETWLLGQKEKVLRQQLERDPRIVSVSSSNYLPAGPSYGNNFFVYEKDITAQIKALRYEVDNNYIPTLGMEMKEGRNFSSQFPTDSNAIILNETAVRLLGWKDNALDKILLHKDNQAITSTYHVIGVVKDFHFKSLHERISPLVMTQQDGGGTLIIKTKTTGIAGVISSIKNQWEQFGTGTTFKYAFLDENFNNTYHAEQTTGMILGIFAGLTIFVACLGLFGLATFTARQRNKEIGIRKVLGASVTNIVALLSTHFLKLVGIAFVIAAPIAWYLMNQWLQGFAYRITITWWVFALAGVMAVCITLLTVSFQAIKAAITNPVKTLKTE
jgi:putative ABC transport system permease protein